MLISHTVIFISCSKDKRAIMDFSGDDEKPDTGSVVIPALANSNRPILICEQSQGKVIIVDSASQGIMWEWKAAASLSATEAKWFTEPDEAKAVYDRKYVLVTASSGGVALVRIVDKKVMFYANAKGSPHSAELLPDGNIVVSCSTNNTTDGDALKIYKVDTLHAFAEKEFARYPLVFGHNAVWDIKRSRLWATDKTNLYSYTYNNGSLIADAKIYSLPAEDPHDLFPVSGKDAFYLTTGKDIFEFDIASGQFLKAAFSMPNIKCVSTGPPGFGILMLQPNQSWWSDQVLNASGKRAFYGKDFRIYKARWFVVNTFSYPQNDSFKQNLLLQ